MCDILEIATFIAMIKVYFTINTAIIKDWFEQIILCVCQSEI